MANYRKQIEDSTDSIGGAVGVIVSSKVLDTLEEIANELYDIQSNLEDIKGLTEIDEIKKAVDKLINELE